MKININAEKKIKVNKGMIGLFFEDINYAADGGLYAEMLENRCFEFVKATGDAGDYQTEYDGSYAWSMYPSGAKGTALLPAALTARRILTICAFGRSRPERAYRIKPMRAFI